MRASAGPAAGSSNRVQRNATAACAGTKTRRWWPRCAGCRRAGHALDTGWRRRICAAKGGRSTTNARSGSGVRRGSKCPAGNASCGVWAAAKSCAQRLRATRVNEVWSYDFVFDQTEDGRRLKWLPICDEFSRESVAWKSNAAWRAPTSSASWTPRWPSAGRPRSSSAATTAPSSSRRPCRLGSASAGSRRSTSRLAVRGRTLTARASTAAFGTLFLNRESFASLLEAKVLGKEHRRDYHQGRLHSSLEYQPPSEFAQRCLATASATLQPPQGSALPTHSITSNPQPDNQQKLS